MLSKFLMVSAIFNAQMVGDLNRSRKNLTPPDKLYIYRERPDPKLCIAAMSGL